MKQPFILSVMHTGTNFLLKLLNVTEFKHVKSPFFDETILTPHLGAIVVPLREPKAIVRSWQRRPDRDMFSLIPSLKLLDALHAKYGFLLMPVDHPNREQYLQRLGEHFGLTLHTDWQPPPMAPIANERKIAPVREYTDDMYAMKLFADVYGAHP